MTWTAEAKLKALVETAGLAEHELGLYLRREGVYSTQIMVWRAEVIAHFETRPKSAKDARDETIRLLEREILRKDNALAEASALLILQKSRLDLGEPTRGRKVTVSDRRAVLALVAEAVAQGARQHAACEMVGVAERTLHRWQCPQTAEDGRRGPRTAPRNTLSQRERDQLVAMAARPEFCNASPHQIVPRLADRGEYLASESSFYRVLKTHDLLTHRGRATPAHRARPRAYEVTMPRTLFSWDITYLLSLIRGQYFYLYLFVDVFSRKAVGAEVHAEESMAHSSRFLDTICREEGIEPHQVSVHADNGGAMKGATMLATMQRLGIVPSFSRPSVRNDNPFSESLFRTLKYCPVYPTKPFASLDAARAWVVTFLQWYHHEHLHSGIRFTTPASRHAGTDTAILHNRDRVYHAAQRTHPSRWSGATRNWTKIERVTLNGLKEGARSVSLANRRTAS